MARPNREKDAALQQIYSRIPELPDCTGQCWTSCGPVGMTLRERQRIRRAGHRITPLHEAMAKVDTYWCEALTADRRCAVYDLRPVVCRLWGTVESMPCIYGCRPQGGYLSDEEGFALLAAAQQVAGPSDQRAALEALAVNPEMREMVAAYIARGQAGDQRRKRQYSFWGEGR